VKSPFDPDDEEINATTDDVSTDSCTALPAGPDDPEGADEADVAVGSPATVTSPVTVVVDSEFTDGNSVCRWHSRRCGVLTAHAGSATSRNRDPKLAPNPFMNWP
jgi:hypothetical protein